MASYEDPKIIDYVMQNDKNQRAEMGIKEWIRKLQIAKQENLMLHKVLLHKLCSKKNSQDLTPQSQSSLQGTFDV